MHKFKRAYLAIPLLYLAILLSYFVAFTEELYHSFSFPEILIAPIMAVGSFVAGSTFLGGGAVAFPALTKIMQADPHTAKTFSLAIQSVGMTSASLFIIATLKKLPLVIMGWFTAGSILGIAYSLSYLDNIFLATDLRIGFSLFIFCFLCVYFWTNFHVSQPSLLLPAINKHEAMLVIFAGFGGGCLSGLLGSGADLIAFCLLALYFKMDIKSATQISVIIMAATSIAGVLMQHVWLNHSSEYVMSLWYIAAPVVLIGAPIGAWFCIKVPSQKLLFFICLIAALELLSTIILIPISLDKSLYYIGIALSTVISLTLLNKLSKAPSIRLTSDSTKGC